MARYVIYLCRCREEADESHSPEEFSLLKVETTLTNTMIEKLKSALHNCFKFPTLLVLPRYRAVLQDLTIEVYAHKHALPLLAQADGVVVAVAPDLKMVFGMSKMVRDRGADTIQQEALKVAPLVPGEAFVGSGAKYRFKHIALAVIFDEFKRPTPEYISKSISNAIRMLREKGAKSVVVADMTENLLAQTNWITDKQREATAELTARIMVEAIIASGGNAKNIKIWCVEPANAKFFINELKRHEQEEKSASKAVPG